MSFPEKCTGNPPYGKDVCVYVYYYGIDKCRTCIHYNKLTDNYKRKDKPHE